MFNRIVTVRSAFLAALGLLALIASPMVAQELKPIFNGTNLDGWIPRGGKAKYEVTNGVIVGTTVKGEPNSFLCTTKDYGDFVLELEINAVKELNSGVQIRSHCFDHPTAFVQDGKTNTIPADRVHGYQIEVDHRPDRRWSGGLYEEGRRGWLQNLTNNPAAQAAFKFGEWNKYRIECVGDHIRTWVNGLPATDAHDSDWQSGFIALQVHNANQAGLQVRFRNFRLTEIIGKNPAAKPFAPSPGVLKRQKGAATAE